MTKVDQFELELRRASMTAGGNTTKVVLNNLADYLMGKTVPPRVGDHVVGKSEDEIFFDLAKKIKELLAEPNLKFAPTQVAYKSTNEVEGR